MALSGSIRRPGAGRDARIATGMGSGGAGTRGAASSLGRERGGGGWQSVSLAPSPGESAGWAGSPPPTPPLPGGCLCSVTRGWKGGINPCLDPQDAAVPPVPSSGSLSVSRWEP